MSIAMVDLSGLCQTPGVSVSRTSFLKEEYGT